MRIALVGCSGPKLDREAPAKDLYTSQLFRKSRAYAEATCDGWAIASARHGLISPWQVLSPYDCKFSDLTRGQRDGWGFRAVSEFGSLAAGAGWLVTECHVVILAGKDYAERLERAWASLKVSKRPVPASVASPLSGLQVGQRLAWLNAELAAIAAKAGA